MSSHALRLPRFAIFALSPLLAFGTCAGLDALWWRTLLPGTIGVDSTIASSSQSGFREGCQSAVYRLSERSAAAIRSGGIAYLSTAGIWHNSDNPYGPWRETPGEAAIHPVPITAFRPAYRPYVYGTCDNDDRRDYHDDDLRRAISRPGSYFTMTRNGEGVIVVAPRERLAAYYYVG